MKKETVTSLNLRLLLPLIKNTLTCEHVYLRFNPEVFSAIIFRALGATTLIYSTGAVVIIGAKEYSCLEKIIDVLGKISTCQASNLALMKLL